MTLRPQARWSVCVYARTAIVISADPDGKSLTKYVKLDYHYRDVLEQACERNSEKCSTISIRRAASLELTSSGTFYRGSLQRDTIDLPDRHGVGLPTLKEMLEHVRYLVIRCRE